MFGIEEMELPIDRSEKSTKVGMLCVNMRVTCLVSTR